MKKTFLKIGNKKIGQGQLVFVIAEAGVNHNGRLDMALKLIDAAAAAGADAVKFQTFKAEQVVTSSGEMAAYQRRNTGSAGKQLSLLRQLELKDDFYKPIMEHCKKRNIIFLSTPHGGFGSVDFLQKLGVPAFKFGSGDLTNLPLLAYAAKFKKPMIISTGMATIAEIKEAVKAVQKAGNNQIIILHCITNYPCPVKEVNLRAMLAIHKNLQLPVGYSDHTEGLQASVMAATLGACMLEKHFTLDKNLSGPDHKASATPQELKYLVAAVRSAETMMGSNQKKPTKSELQFLPLIRKSIVAARNIKKGEKFSVANLSIKRPGHGLEPRHYFKLMGKKATEDIIADTLLQRKHYES